MAHHDDIARRAYELYEARGRQDGHDGDDWLQAERELQALDAAGQQQSVVMEETAASASSSPRSVRRKERAGPPATL